MLGVWCVAGSVWRLACGVWRLAFGVWRVACGVWRLAFGVWRVAFGVWRLAFGVLFFLVGVWLCNCRPPPSAGTGGIAAAGGAWRPLAALGGPWRLRGMGQAAVGRHLAALPPKAYKVALIHTMLNTTTIMLTSEWLIHRVYKRFCQKV